MEFTSAFDYKSIYSYNKNKYADDGTESLLVRDKFAAHQSSSSESFQCSSIITGIATAICYVFVIITFPVFFFFYLRRVKPFERAVIFRLGKVRSSEGPGIVFVLPCLDKCSIISLQETDIEIPAQQFLSSDNAVVQCGAKIRFRISDPIRYSTCYYDPDHQGLQSLVKSILLRVGGAHEERAFQPDTYKDSLSELISKEVNHLVNAWGIDIVTTFIVETAVIKPAEEHSNGIKPLLQSFFGGAGNSAAGAAATGQSLMSNLMNFQQAFIPNDEPPTRHEVIDECRDDDDCPDEYIDSGSVLRRRIEETLAKSPATYSGGSERVILRLEVTLNDGSLETIYVNVSQKIIVSQEQHQISIKGSEETITGLLNRTLSPTNAYFTSQISVEGDMKLLEKFTDLI